MNDDHVDAIALLDESHADASTAATSPVPLVVAHAPTTTTTTASASIQESAAGLEFTPTALAFPPLTTGAPTTTAAAFASTTPNAQSEQPPADGVTTRPFRAHDRKDWIDQAPLSHISVEEDGVTKIAHMARRCGGCSMSKNCTETKQKKFYLLSCSAAYQHHDTWTGSLRGQHKLCLKCWKRLQGRCPLCHIPPEERRQLLKRTASTADTPPPEDNSTPVNDRPPGSKPSKPVKPATSTKAVLRTRLAEKDSQLEALKSKLADKDAEIDRLKQQLTVATQRLGDGASEAVSRFVGLVNGEAERRARQAETRADMEHQRAERLSRVVLKLRQLASIMMMEEVDGLVVPSNNNHRGNETAERPATVDELALQREAPG
eukprot:jgi/Chlat1/1768/Chrsp134S02091